MRSLATNDQLAGRASKMLSLEEMRGREVWIDGFNLIITLEVMMSDSICLQYMDGTIRDLPWHCAVPTS